MFGQVLDKLDTYFGRSFLLARYVPWLLCLAANALLAAIEFPKIRESLLRAATDLNTERAIALLLVLLVVWVFAYGTSPVVQFVTGFLEGSNMPTFLQHLLVLSHAWRRDELERTMGVRFRHRADSDFFEGLLGELDEAKRLSARLRRIGNPEAINAAAKAVGDLAEGRWFVQTISLAQLRQAVGLLAKALRENCSNPEVLVEKNDQGRATELDGLHRQVWSRLVPYAKAVAEELDQRAAVERHRRFAAEVLAPTGLGNEAAALRSYCATRYGIDFDFFWPRFLVVARNDAKLSDALASAKIQLDFSIAALTLSTLSVLGWVLLLGLQGSSLLAAALVFGLGPLAVYAWAGIVHAAYSEFADVVRSAIDLRRFDVLSSLRQALPVTSSDESRCWEAVQRLALFDEHRPNVALRHPAT